MATAAMTAAYPVPGASYPGRVGGSFMSVGAGKPTSHGLDQDYTLVQRCLSGDAAGWEELVRVHTRRVYGLCYRFTSSDTEAQDLTQDIFLRVFRSLKSYRSTEGAFSTWLTRLSRNLLIDHYRRTRQERLTDPIEDQLTVLEQKEHGGMTSARPDRALAGREASEILQAALAKLSPELRETVILRDLQELEYREVAEVARLLRKQQAAL